MPLLDHFHPPLSKLAHWESFHAQWAGCIQAYLNRNLPQPRYRAEVQVHFGRRVEIDVAEFEYSLTPPAAARESPGGVATAELAPGVATAELTMPMILPDDVEILVHDVEDGKNLVAAIELASPGNKDRTESRRAFAMKCAAYLHKGIGLIVMDTVTSRAFCLHNELVHLLGQGQPFLLPADLATYAVAYRPAHRANQNELDLWRFPLGIGERLPLAPLALRGGCFVTVDFEEPYQEACERAALS